MTYSEIEKVFQSGKPISFKDYKIPKENEENYVEILENILKFLGKEKVSNQLTYCLRELIGNAKKANTKRVYFIDENLDINNPAHYEKAMKEFKEKTSQKLDYYLELQEKYNLFVQVYFHVKEPYLNIIVSNNTPLLPQEKERIAQKMARARVFSSIDEAVQNVLDDTEGAGLGIVILILILRKIGINDKNFAVAVQNDTTHIRIAMPLSLVSEEETEIISDSLISEINSIPQFPEHILKLTNMLMDREVNFYEITQIIRRDPGLTMDILKMSNSAHYKRLNKIEKIDHAVSILGVNGLKYLLQSYGAKKALEKKYANKDLTELWIHSMIIAQISSILCEKFKLLELGDYAYIGGLLHDIGKIVIKGLHSGTIDKINKISMEKGISVNIIENLLEGTNHNRIGTKMAEKWNLPDNICRIIKYHDNPLASEDDIKEIVNVIYFAHLINGKLFPENYPDESMDLEDMILNQFSINSQEKYTELLTYIKNELQKRM